MVMRPRLLSVGDRVRFAGREQTVVALSGLRVRLVDDDQEAAVVLLTHLVGSEGFEVLSAVSARSLVPASGVLDGLSQEAVERAEWWQRHLVEVLTGRAAG
ncbi:hypothetical protein [Streptomyces hyaluromycini]|uniref:hypothetical protein n=1 Tax=Streptomyces hyaluromycini TaxID=1377993 RepID=UPI001237FBD1